LPTPNDPNIVLDTFAQRNRLLFAWQMFFQDWPLIAIHPEELASELIEIGRPAVAVVPRVF